MWLVATARGLSIQPLTGILFFHLQIVNGEGSAFTDRERQRIEQAYKDIQHLARTNKNVVFMARIGRGAPPTARSSKFTFDVSVEEI